MGRISMPQGRGSQLHNRRDYEKIGREIPGNIVKENMKYNDVFIDKDINETYDEIFGEALEKYNSKQKRADRKIEDYYTHISKSKNGEKLFYEDVLQWGKKEDFENNPENIQKSKEALSQYARTFQERNPNLILIGAYLHMDEASPHLHLDYIPVAHGYSRGLETRNSLDKAMKEMGFIPQKESRKNNATKLWKEGERKYFGEICRSLGLEVEAERKARGDLSVEEYKELKDAAYDKFEKEADEEIKDYKDRELKKVDKGIREEVVKMDAVNHLMADTDEIKVHVQNLSIPEKKGLFGKIEEPERQGVFVEGVDREQLKTIIKRSRVVEGIDNAYENAQERIRTDIRKAKNEATEIRQDAAAESQRMIAEAHQRAEAEMQQVQMQVEQVNEMVAQKEKLEKEIHSLKRTKEQTEKEVERVEHNLRCYENGWIDNQGNIHKGEKEVSEEYEQTCEKLQEVKEQVERKLYVATKELQPEEVKRMLGDSMITNIVQETIMQTCKQLEEQGELKSSYNMAFIKVDKNKIIESLKVNIEKFIDNVKEHMQEVAERVIHHKRHR